MLHPNVPRALIGTVHAEVDPKALVQRINAAVEEIRTDHARRITEIETAMDNAETALNNFSDRLANQSNGPSGFDPLTGEVRSQFVSALRGAPQAAMEIGSDPDGGFTVPTQVDGAIMSLLRDRSPLRSMATVVTLGKGSGSWRKIVKRTGGSSRWAHELETREDTDTPVLGAVEITPSEVYAIPEITNFILDDSSFDLKAFLDEDVAAEFVLAENEAFIGGDGVKKPLGLVHRATTDEADAVRAFGTYQHVVSGVDGDFLADGDGGFQNNLIDLIFSLPAPYRSGQGVGWLMNSLTASIVMKFRDGDGRLLWREALDAREPARLLGYPVGIDESMPDIEAGALAIAFGNWKRGYAIVDRPGMSLIRDNVTKKGWTKFYFSKRTGGAPLDTNAIKFLKFSAA
ncbi:phage major capsid protein [uncultured Parasphingopyxis sp.]|uniref:phage major capsid protein n=1 Tax=uncultured Parasphingopyxis sp. TaxID=1547918 RepID=UPI00261B96FB|nr:phage major capsid protein [uncultured Parasphingopyxis sp.]